MAKKKSILQQMADNPANDWDISAVEKLCKEVGLTISNPSHGSHYKVSSDRLEGILTIPAKRPIKVVYIKNLVGLSKAHQQKASQ